MIRPASDIMADVTPPGEGPPPMGHAVDPECRDRRTTLQPTPLGVLGEFTDRTLMARVCYGRGTELEVATPCGLARVVVGEGGRLFLLRDHRDMPAGREVVQHDDENFYPSNDVPKSGLAGFLNKGGPVPETPEQKRARDTVARLTSELQRLQADKRETARRRAIADMDAEDSGRKAHTPAPGRAGRAIEFD
jgi:hypothetical protein